MRIKSFYSDSMDGALQSASKELGDEALILNTRETPNEFRHFGRYEVVCAVAHEPAPVPVEAAPLTYSNLAPTLPEPRRAVAPVEPARPAPARTGTARIAFLVGPSGSGKSTTCAKIAIQAKFDQSQQAVVLSWDTHRVGGADGLRSYCEIGGVPFEVITSTTTLLAMLDSYSTSDLILVDTTAIEGDMAAAQELREAIALLPQAEVHLVVSSTCSSQYLEACQQTYLPLGVRFLLPTHLDQARMQLDPHELESLRGLTIQWCGTGRSVPEDLEDAGRVLEKVARLDRPAPAETDFRIEAMHFPSLEEEAPEERTSVPTTPQRSATPAPATASARTAIESILARFRRTEQSAQPGADSNKKSSAA